MRINLKKLIFIFMAATLLLSSLSSAKSRWSRDDLPPNSGSFLGEFSSFHRPWYGGRREIESPKKVFEIALLSFHVREIVLILKCFIKNLSPCDNAMIQLESLSFRFQYKI